MFLLQLVQSEIVFWKKILFWNFGLKKGKKSCLKTPFSENRDVFGWILKANFHVLMPFLWTKSVFMPKYGKSCVNKCQKKNSRKRWFWVMTTQKSKILKNSQVRGRFFLGSKKSEWSHILFYIVQYVYFRNQKSLACAFKDFGWKIRTKIAF